MSGLETTRDKCGQEDSTLATQKVAALHQYPKFTQFTWEERKRPLSPGRLIPIKFL